MVVAEGTVEVGQIVQPQYFYEEEPDFSAWRNEWYVRFVGDDQDYLWATGNTFSPSAHNEKYPYHQIESCYVVPYIEPI